MRKIVVRADLIRPRILLVSCLIILAGLIGVASVTQVHGQDCLPIILEVHNTYPQFVNPNQETQITTTITVSCITLGYVTRVDIMPAGYTRILTSASGPIAINRVTAPETNGPWSLDIVTSLIDYPYGRVLDIKRDPITIQVVPSPMSTTQLITTQYSTTTTKLTFTAPPITSTTIETHTFSGLLLPQDQTIAPAAIIFAALLTIAAMMLLRVRRGRM